jgi:hypothetical protein
MALQVSIEKSDVTSVETDVLLLKYAQRLYGADESVAIRLFQRGTCTEEELAPEPAQYRFWPTRGAIGARHALFLGTPRLQDFRYDEMGRFAARAIEILAREKTAVRSLATTVHGAGYGLDIEEALRSLILGFQQGLTTHRLASLQRIVFVEQRLHFDLSHHKCIFYRTIGKLSESLEKTIRDMFGPSSGERP